MCSANSTKACVKLKNNDITLLQENDNDIREIIGTVVLHLVPSPCELKCPFKLTPDYFNMMPME